jgi:hypothetical protein
MMAQSDRMGVPQGLVGVAKGLVLPLTLLAVVILVSVLCNSGC